MLIMLIAPPCRALNVLQGGANMSVGARSFNQVRAATFCNVDKPLRQIKVLTAYCLCMNEHKM